MFFDASMLLMFHREYLRTGHLLFSSSSTGQRASLVPPLKGYWTLPNVLRWIRKEERRPTFVSRYVRSEISLIVRALILSVTSLPVPLIDSTPANQRIMHRLAYHALSTPTSDDNPVAALPVKFIRMEAVLAEAKTQTEKGSSSSLLSSSSEVEEESEAVDTAVVRETNSSSITSEDISSSMETSISSVSEVEDLPPATQETEADVASLYRCWTGSQATLDLLMPDRYDWTILS